MPGVMTEAQCQCGFQCHVRHGFVFEGAQLQVVAYSKDGNGLETLMEDEAKKRGMEIIPYPNGSGNRCPKCGQNTLSFFVTGHWD
jgi:hypothetical protein